MGSFFMLARASFSAASLARIWRLLGSSPQSAMVMACRVRPELDPHVSILRTTGIPSFTRPNTTAPHIHCFLAPDSYFDSACRSITGRTGVARTIDVLNSRADIKQMGQRMECAARCAADGISYHACRRATGTQQCRERTGSLQTDRPALDSLTLIGKHDPNREGSQVLASCWGLAFSWSHSHACK